MPTYDYVCKACGHEFEQFQSMSEGALRKCPECGKLQLKRLIGAGGGLIFKGSGFYITDYRSKSYESDAAAEKGGSSKDSKSTDSKPESKKPESTSSPKGEAPKESKPKDSK
ncbi:MAG: zinc ribbon domain-containing protein [Planctomycetota bacterium]